MYFLKDYKGKGYDAGSKARIDCEKIMQDSKFKPVDFYLGGRKTYYMSSLKRYKESKKLKSGDVLVIQYPYHFKYRNNFFSSLQKLRRKNIRIVAIIHDVLSLRTSNKEINIEDEINIFNSFDWIISHNEEMSKFLTENGLKTEFVNLEIFDYLMDDIDNKEIEDFKNIYIAGNLSSEKSQYIYNSDFRQIKSNMYLYGPNFEQDSTELKNTSIEYKGCFPPEDLGKEIKNGFGLVWDGTSIDSCDGTIGEYLKYNNPHKTSMYLSIGIPVIIWEKAALAKFIQKNGLGICVKSLKDIDKVLEKMTKDEYIEIKKNCEKISEKIKNGYFLKSALENIVV